MQIQKRLLTPSFVFLLFSFFSLTLEPKLAHAENTQPSGMVEVDPIILNATPAEALQNDPIMKPKHVTNTQAGATVSKELSQQLPYHFADNSKPGSVVSIRGWGADSAETDVNTLGIPLNPAQGGGLDLSTFPAFLWSDIQYQSGPSLNGYDPRAISGSANFKLWTQQMLSQNVSDTSVYSLQSRFMGFANSNHFQQLSGAISDQKNFAFNLGHSSGYVHGPAGSLSVKKDFDDVSVKFHLLGTAQEVTHLESEHASTANGVQNTYRLIPMLQTDFKLPHQAVLKTSLYVDGGYTKFEDPSTFYGGHALSIKSHSWQYGAQLSYLQSDLRLGISARNASYETSSFNPPKEGQGMFVAGYTFHLTPQWTLLPLLQTAWVQRFNPAPSGNIGIRFQNTPENQYFAWYLRTGYAKKFPTLLDRYYDFLPYAVGNRNLQPEEAITAQTGVEWVEKTYSTQLSFLGQWRQKTRFYSPFDGFNPGIVINAGNSHVAGINWGLDVLVDDHFTLKNNAAYHTSYVEDTKSSFVLQPRMVNTTELRYHSTLTGKTEGNVSLLQKVSSHFNQTVTKVAPGYGVTDFRLGVNNLADQFDITFNIENIFNRKLKLRTDDSLTVGRVYSLNLTGRF